MIAIALSWLSIVIILSTSRIVKAMEELKRVIDASNEVTISGEDIKITYDRLNGKDS